MTATHENISQLDKIPAFVNQILVSGLGRTDESLVKKQFRKLVQSENLNDLFENVKEAKERLNKLGVFRYVFAVVDVAKEPNQYNIAFRVEEKRPTTARLSVTHGTDGTSKLCGSVRVNNLARGAELADLDLEFGTDRLTSKCATLSKPLEANPFVRFSIGGTEGSWDHSWAKFMRHERSVFSEIKAETDLGVHKFQWDAIWRELEAKDNSTPWLIRKQSGPVIKVGLRHTFERDSRSDLVFPDAGFLCRLTQELSTLSPGDPSGKDETVTAGISQKSVSDNAFQLRLEALAHKPFRLTDWLVGELTLSTGLTHSLTRHPVHIADRFFLGGPLELRGFRWRTVSPVEPLLVPTPFQFPNDDSNPSESTVAPPANPTSPSIGSETATCPVGAEAFWLAGAHLYTPLPYFGDQEGTLASQFRLHGFYLLGNTMEDNLIDRLFSTSTDGASRERLKDVLCARPRAVVGAGLVVRFAGVLRIEVNYCIPHVLQPGDSAKSGFNFGIGMYYS